MYVLASERQNVHIILLKQPLYGLSVRPRERPAFCLLHPGDAEEVASAKFICPHAPEVPDGILCEKSVPEDGCPCGPTANRQLEQKKSHSLRNRPRCLMPGDFRAKQGQVDGVVDWFSSCQNNAGRSLRKLGTERRPGEYLSI
jgi:hypothetical protein